MAKRTKKTNDTAAIVDYEAQLWQMADALRGTVDAAEYKHPQLLAEKACGAYPEDPDDQFAFNGFGRPKAARRASAECASQYSARSNFCVLPEGHGPHLKDYGRQSAIDQLSDDAVAATQLYSPALAVGQLVSGHATCNVSVMTTGGFWETTAEWTGVGDE
jgi:type I restriction enzyme M protein